MTSAADGTSRQQGTGKVLLAGDIRNAFLDADGADRYGCVVHANILDAIDAAAKGSYDLVGVVMGSRSGGGASRLGAALRALRRGTKARIVLLAAAGWTNAAIARRRHAPGEGVELDRLERRDVFAMRVRAALFDVHGRGALPFPIAAVVISRGENHGLVRPQPGKALVAPMGGELRGQFGVIFL